MDLKVCVIVLCCSLGGAVRGLPVFELDSQQPAAEGRQGILEYPKQVATIIRNVIEESLERVWSTTRRPSTTTTASPKGAQQSSSSGSKVDSTTKDPNDTFLGEFILNNIVITSTIPPPTQTSPAAITNIADNNDQSNYAIVENAFTKDFEDRIYLLGIPTTDATKSTFGPSPPEVITPEEEDLSTTDQFEEETTEEPSSISTNSNEDEESTTTDPEEDAKDIDESEDSK